MFTLLKFCRWLESNDTQFNRLLEVLFRPFPTHFNFFPFKFLAISTSSVCQIDSDFRRLNQPASHEESQPVSRSPDRPVGWSVSQSVGQTVSQSVDKSVSQADGQSASY